MKINLPKNGKVAFLKYLYAIGWLVALHVLCLLLTGFFRLLLFLAERPLLPPSYASDWQAVGTAFIRGLWFDNVIGCYILLLPLVVVGAMGIAGHYPRLLLRAVGIWLGILYAVVLMLSAGNVPYFHYFTHPLNSSIFNWVEYGGTTLSMMFGESSYWGYIAACVANIVLLVWCIRRSRKWLLSRLTTLPKAGASLWAVPVTLALAGLCLFGIRGRRGYNPIKVSAAYFCDNTILNQLGISPVFSLLTSVLDDGRKENRTLHLMKEDEALRNACKWLNRKGVEGVSPLARRVPQRPSALARRNVVLILMESMSARLMGTFGNKAGLTPCLDSLYERSLSFRSFYSSGNHTNHGLYATLYGFPSIMFRNAMKGTAIPTYSGLPTVLREEGYQTLFFMTHEAQYDNMNAFLRTNGYEEIFSQENYPKSRIVNSFGVQDDFLFGYALPVLRQRAERGAPFFATLLTISNHPPYVIPEWFSPKSEDEEEQIVEYADRCVGNFMAQAAREPWFNNTIFVLLGDHGKVVGPPDCELQDSFNHIPLIIYGHGIAAEERTDFCGQVDVPPTLLALLGIGYTQNNLGIDLTSEQRPCMFYSADKTVAARDAQRLYVYSPEAAREWCYNTSNGVPELVETDAHFAFLKSYCFSMLQATESLVQRKQTTDRPQRR